MYGRINVIQVPWGGVLETGCSGCDLQVVICRSMAPRINCLWQNLIWAALLDCLRVDEQVVQSRLEGVGILETVGGFIGSMIGSLLSSELSEFIWPEERSQRLYIGRIFSLYRIKYRLLRGRYGRYRIPRRHRRNRTTPSRVFSSI